MKYLKTFKESNLYTPIDIIDDDTNNINPISLMKDTFFEEMPKGEFNRLKSILANQAHIHYGPFISSFYNWAQDVESVIIAVGVELEIRIFKATDYYYLIHVIAYEEDIEGELVVKDEQFWKCDTFEGLEQLLSYIDNQTHIILRKK